MDRWIDHIYIVATIVFTVSSQLLIRWQVGEAGSVPADIAGKIHYIFALLLSPWVLAALAATFLAGLSWMLAMTRFEISYAYPFVSLNYVLILMAGFLLFGESLGPAKFVGSALIILGIIVVARG